MSIFRKIFMILLIVIISFYAFYFLVVYSDLVLSGLAKKKLSWAIIYSPQALYIKAIELPSGKTKILYSVPRNQERYLASVLNPSFSPDGRKIVFSRRDDPRVGRRYKLWIMNSDGTDMEKIFGVYDRDLFSPSFSPDGKKISFISRNSERGGQGELYIIGVGNISSIDLISNILPSLTSQVTWLPDSKIFLAQKSYLVNP